MSHSGPTSFIHWSYDSTYDFHEEVLQTNCYRNLRLSSYTWKQHARYFIAQLPTFKKNKICFNEVHLPVSLNWTKESSSSVTYRLSIASFIWLLRPLGSRSMAQEKFIKARWVLPSFLWTCKKNIWAILWQNQQNRMCTQVRLRSAWASAQSDQSSLCAQWVAKDPSFLHAVSNDSNQTGRMKSSCHFVGFVMRRLKYIFAATLWHWWTELDLWQLGRWELGPKPLQAYRTHPSFVC